MKRARTHGPYNPNPSWPGLAHFKPYTRVKDKEYIHSILDNSTASRKMRLRKEVLIRAIGGTYRVALYIHNLCTFVTPTAIHFMRAT